MTVGEKIRELRETKGFTQVQLAGALSLTQGAIGHLETGRTKATFDVIHKLCKALGVRCTVFDGCDFGEGEDKPGRGRPKKTEMPEAPPAKAKRAKKGGA